MMGEIEPEADPAKIHFVFCSPTEALHMVGNKHIHVQVPQLYPLYPLSKEVTTHLFNPNVQYT